MWTDQTPATLKMQGKVEMPELGSEVRLKPYTSQPPLDIYSLVLQTFHWLYAVHEIALEISPVASIKSFQNVDF